MHKYKMSILFLQAFILSSLVIVAQSRYCNAVQGDHWLT